MKQNKQKPKKDLYRYYLTVTAADGSKRKIAYSSTDQKEAKRKRDRAKLEYEAGLLTFSGRTTVKQYAETFADQMHLGADDRSRLQRLLIDQIGGLRMDEVKAPNIRQCFSLLEGKSKSTVSKGCAVINRLFETAVADELILRNPCAKVQRPRPVETSGRRSLTEAEETVFLDLLRERVTDGRHAYDIAWGIMYACGLRPGEVRALLRSHVQFGAAPCIEVVQACKNKSRTIGPPKTAAGFRSVPIPEWFVPLLRQAMSKDSLFVVPGPDGECQSYQTMKRRWERFYNALRIAAGAKTYRNQITVSPLGSDLDPYCLRHAYCTNLAYARIPEVVAMKWMGHDDPNMVRKIYADADNTKLLRRAIEDLNAAAPNCKSNKIGNTKEEKTSARL